MPFTEIATYLGIIAGALVSLGVIWKGAKMAYAFCKRIDQANSIMLEFPAWRDKVDHSMKELHPNHGTSMRDELNRISKDVCETKRLMQSHLSDPRAHSAKD